MSELEDKTNGRRKSIKVKLPGGAEIEIRGYDIVIIILVASSAIGTWLLWGFKQDHDEMKDAFAEMVYILTLTPEERTRLNIAMPRSLREKSRNFRWSETAK